MTNMHKNKNYQVRFETTEQRKAICYQHNRWSEYQGTKSLEEVKYKMYKKYKLIKSWCCPRAKPVSWHTCSDRPPRKRDEQYSLFPLKCNIVINMDAHVEYQISNVFNNGNVSYDVISVAIIRKLLLSFLPPTLIFIKIIHKKVLMLFLY